MAKRGGKRQGAGRKKAQHTIETEAMRAFIVSEVNKQLKPLLEAKFDLALGVRVQDNDGEAFYTRPPDGNAIQYLLNQSIGKPKESVEHSGKLTIGQILKRLNDGETATEQDMEDEPPLQD
jgi:hypothetical protein